MILDFAHQHLCLSILFVPLKFMYHVSSSCNKHETSNKQKYAQSQGFTIIKYTSQIIDKIEGMSTIILVLIIHSDTSYFGTFYCFLFYEILNCVMIVSSITVTFCSLEQVVFLLEIIIWEARREQGG